MKWIIARLNGPAPVRFHTYQVRGTFWTEDQSLASTYSKEAAAAAIEVLKRVEGNNLVAQRRES